MQLTQGQSLTKGANVGQCFHDSQPTIPRCQEWEDMQMLFSAQDKLGTKGKSRWDDKFSLLVSMK